MDIDDNQTGVLNHNISDVNELADVNLEERVKELQNQIQKMGLEHRSVVADYKA